MSVFTPNIQTTKNNSGTKLLWALCNRYSESVGALDNHHNDPKTFLKVRDAIIQFFTERMTKGWVFDWKVIIDSHLFDLPRLQWDIEILNNISRNSLNKHAMLQLEPLDPKTGLFIQKEVDEYLKIAGISFDLKMRTGFIGIDGYSYNTHRRPHNMPTYKVDKESEAYKKSKLEFEKKQADLRLDYNHKAKRLHNNETEADNSACVIC